VADGACVFLKHVLCSVQKKEFFVHTITYTAFRENLATYMNKVNEDHAPLLITRQGAKPAVLVSLEDFQGYEETAYLTANPANAARLKESLEEYKAGKYLVKPLFDTDD
jgi:antitoxin YefM